MQSSRKGVKRLDGATESKSNDVSSSYGNSAHPLEKFDILLKAFDGFTGGPAGGSDVNRSSHFTGIPFTSTSNIGNIRNKIESSALGFNQRATKQGSRVTQEDDDVGRFPRLYSRSSSASALDPGLREAVGTNAKRRRISWVKSSPVPPQTLRNTSSIPLGRERRLPCYLNDDPLALMLRSKGRQRPDREDQQIRTGSATGSGHENIDAQSRGGAASTRGSGSKTLAGIFRLTHAGTGFVHYGYSWDIAGAEADQLRLLGMECDDGSSSTSEAPHPHRGLSALVRAQKGKRLRSRDVKPQDARGSSFQPLGDASKLCLRFEVVRRVPLPTRFRASDFETQMREICTQELLRRRALVLALVAQRYRKSHADPAFSRMLLGFRREVENEEFAAASEIQRAWRGYQVRGLARHKRQMRCRERLDTEKVRLGAIVAVWVQAKHRGHAGRRRARGLRNERTVEAAAREKQASVTAAVTIQEWLRSVYHKRRMAAAAADKTANEAFLQSILRDKNEELSPPTGKPSVGETRRPPRPISASEARVASRLCDVGPEASITKAQEWSLPAHNDSTGGKVVLVSIEKQQQRRRPSSSRGRGSTTHPCDHGNATQERQRWSSMEHGDIRPFSAPEQNTVLDKVCSVESPPEVPVLALSTLPDASRLVLEGDPHFTAAMAIQAAWRGFVARMGVRKRRRVAAALRRKREGKWRQQRGVVGKRMEVAWDERRDFEEGGEEDGARARRKTCCIEIQRVWRGALGRKSAHLLCQKQAEEMAASVQIQRIYRGMVGKRQAGATRAMRNKTTAAAFLITRQALRFLRNIGVRHQRRHLAATLIQCIVRGLASRRRVYRMRCSRVEHTAAQKVQMMARGWLGRRQAWQRSVLTRWGACALCCSRLAEMYFEVTEQELCLECYRTTGTVLQNRKVPPAHSEGAFEMLDHRKRQKAATLTQRAWLGFQRRASTRFGACEACPRWAGPGSPLPRAARTVCIAGCDRRRHLRYCRRCCAITHSLRATTGHEIRSVDRYGTEMAAVATLGGAMWRYNIKRRFWRIFETHRRTLKVSATLLQSRWRSYRCRSVFAALRRGFLYVEAAARSAEHYWLIPNRREDIMGNIAGCMALNIQALPPGIHPAPSGHFALWETLVMEVVRTRAVVMIQQQWRKKMERAVARALAHVARLQKVERERLRALAELRASVDIQRTFRGFHGRTLASRRAATLAFARVTAERYANPDRFAVANLRAFNAHGGFLGIAGVDARSLLASAVGVGERGCSVAVSEANRRKSCPGAWGKRGEEAEEEEEEEESSKSEGVVWLRLRRKGECNWGLSADVRVAGITEVGIRACLRRYSTSSLVRVGMAGPGAGEGSDVEKVRNTELSEKNVGFGDDDVPPLTLKLELISVRDGCHHMVRRCSSEEQAREAAIAPVRNIGRDDDPSLASTDDISEEGDSSSERRRCRRGCSVDGERAGARNDNSTSTRSYNSDPAERCCSGGSDSDGSEWSRETSTTVTSSDGNGTIADMDDGSIERRSIYRDVEYDPGTTEHRHVEYQCDVAWCGKAVGGTRARLSGLPVPRWEGQVFYLPLHAAGTYYHGGKSSSEARERGYGDARGADSCFPHSFRGRENLREKTEPLSSLLAITLNKLSLDINGHIPCMRDEDGEMGSPGTTLRCRKPWSAFLSGIIDPIPVGRAVLEAGDVLSMLGSQQVVNVIPASRSDVTEEESSSQGDSEKAGGSVPQKRPGWHLQLLLSLEDRERTRTRILVTDVLAGIMEDIVNIIPGKVARIEIRVAGIRALATAIASPGLSAQKQRRIPKAATAALPSHHEPSLHLLAEWNGDPAASVDLSPFEDDSPIDTEFPPNGNDGHLRGDHLRGDKRLDGGGRGSSSGERVYVGYQARHRSRLVMLPMYVPWIMRGFSDNGVPCLDHTEIQPGNNDPGGGGDGGGGYHGHGTSGGNDGCGCGWGGGGDDSDLFERSGGFYESEGGRSHRLRVTVGSALGCDRIDSDTYGGACYGFGHRAKVSSPSPSNGPIPERVQQQTEVCFFERDLLRKEWTEYLVPVPADLQEVFVPRRGRVSRSRKQQQRPPSQAVVLHVRSAGFHPKTTPLWLVRRDFAEREVKRLISAAAAAVVQPRVEIHIIGLSGAVESMVSKRDGDVLPRVPASSRRVEHEGESSGDAVEEVLCEVFWNGTLAHGLRLRRAAASTPTAAPEGTAEKLVSPRRSKGELLFNTDNRGGVKGEHPAQAGRLPPAAAAASDDLNDSDDKKHFTIDGTYIDPPGEMPERRTDSEARDADPSTWFSNSLGGNGDGSLRREWVTVREGDPSSHIFSSGQEDPVSQDPLADQAKSSTTSPDEERRASVLLSGRTDGAEEGGGGKALDSLAWVPVEGDPYAGRPVRLFLSAVLVDDGTEKQTEQQHRPGDAQGGERRVDASSAVDGESVGAERSKENQCSAGGAGIKGDLRLVFWVIPSSSPASSTAMVAAASPASREEGGRMDEDLDLLGDGGRSNAVIATLAGETSHKDHAARRRRLRGDKNRRLLGWAGLVDDELLLQPVGQRIDLALSAKAGLDPCTAWSMAHDLKRKVTAYRSMGASVVAIVRHFDVPRDRMLRLECPAPFLEVEVVDGHGLPKSSGQLSINPYVVLTLDGEPFARSSTSRGAAFPVWSSEVFMVKLPSPPPGTWPLTVQSYFDGYRGAPFILGARVYSQVGPQAASSILHEGILHGGVGEGDVLLGEAALPFPLLKELPFHYLPLRLQPPPLTPQTRSCAYRLGGALGCTSHTVGKNSGGGGSGHTLRCTVCSSCGRIADKASVDHVEKRQPENGLLGIGVRMVFPKPVIPDASGASSDGLAMGSSISLSPSGMFSGAGKRAAVVDYVVGEGREIVLSVYEAEALANNGESGRILSSFCVVLVNEVEVGRTVTIPSSPEPLWAAEFHLPDNLLLDGGRLPSTDARKGGGRGGDDGQHKVPTRPPIPWADRVSKVALELYNSVPEGDPVLLGAAEIPSGLLCDMLSAPEVGDRETKTCHSTSGEEEEKKRKISTTPAPSGLHMLTLNLGPRKKQEQLQNSMQHLHQHQHQQLVDAGNGQNETNTTSEGYRGFEGTLSLSLRRVLPTPDPSSAKDRGKPGDTLDDNPGLAPLADATVKAAGGGSGSAATRMSGTAIQRYLAAKMESLAESTREARKRLDEARTVMEEAASASRGRSAHDCPKENAERFVRVWKRETARAERAESLAAGRPTVELPQDKIRQARKAKKRPELRPRSAEPTTHGGRSHLTEVSPADGKLNRRSQAGKDDIDVCLGARSGRSGRRPRETPHGIGEPSAVGLNDVVGRQQEVLPMISRLKAPVVHGTKVSDVKKVGEDSSEMIHHSKQEEGHSEAGVELGDTGGDEKQDREEEEVSVLERNLPPLPASRNGVFVKVEAVLGLDVPFTARGKPVSARVFWGGLEVARTSSITPSQQAAPPPHRSASAASPTDTRNAAEESKNQEDEDDNKKNMLLVPENLTNDMQDAAATATTRVVQATSAMTHRLAAGAGGCMEGRWEREIFLLPVPDGENILLVDQGEGAEGVGASRRDDDTSESLAQDDVDAPDLLGPIAEGFGEIDVDTTSGDTCSASVDDGVHLRVEVWQGKHCHGQIELEGSELLRMCKKIHNATPGGRADFVVDNAGGGGRLPDYFPHFLPNPETFSPYKLALVPREGDAPRKEYSAAPPARLALALLAIESGQVVAAQGQLAVALQEMGSRGIQRQEDGRTGGVQDATVGPAPRDGESAGGDARAKTTGVAEALVKVLTTRRSPLSMRLQPLVIHLDSFDDKNYIWTDEDYSPLFLVARREVLVTFGEGSSLSDGKMTAAGTVGRGGVLPAASSLSEHHQSGGDRCQHAARNRCVAEEEELGRSPCFGLHSAVIVVPSSSFTIPPSALIAGIQRRNGKGARKDTIVRQAPATSGDGEPEVRIVLEVVQGADEGIDCGERGSISNDEKRTRFLKTLKRNARGSSSDGGDGGGERVVARANLDPGFLRRTIGCPRTVVLMTVADTVGGVAAPTPGKREGEQSHLPSIFARLDVAGHVVCARPGLPKLRLQIFECQNLRSADMLGKSDPCVLVFWNGVEVGRTPIVRDDLHPVFPKTSSIFRFSLAPPRTSKIHNRRESIAAGGRDQRDSFTESVDWQAYAPELRLEVWDMDRDTFSRKWKKGQLLGDVNLRGPSGIAPVIEASTEQTSRMVPMARVDKETPGVFVRLSTADRRVSKRGSGAGKTDQGSSGVVSLSLVLENGTDESDAWVSQASGASSTATASDTISVRAPDGEAPTGRGSSSYVTGAPAQSSSLPGLLMSGPTGVIADAKLARRSHLVIRCLDARGLPSGCDGYCRVFWNGRQVGRTLPASFFAPGTRGTATKRDSAPASALQRNPVWWKSSTQTRPDEGCEDREARLRISDATAAVPLYENPKEGDELTLEVFDGSHTHAVGQRSTVDAVAKHQTSPRDTIAGKDTTGAPRNDGTFGAGSEVAKAVRRDFLGRSLGSVTVRGEYVVRPPHGRIDLPLTSSPSSSSRDSNAGGITLSISLKRLIAGRESANPTTSVTTQQQERTQEHNDRVSPAPTASSTGKAVAAGEGAQAHVLQENMYDQRPKRRLRLLLREARLRKGLDLSGTSDPFCTIYVDRVWCSETRVCWGTLAPRWDQWVQVEVFGRGGAPAMGLGLVGHEIRVEVWDKDVIGADDFIGEVHLFLNENRDGSVDVRTRANPKQSPKGTTSDRQDSIQDISKAAEGRGLQHHSLELRREGKPEDSPRTCHKHDKDTIGTLFCATLVSTERNWRTEVASMNLPWVLGAPGALIAGNREDCIVIQLVGAVLQAGNQLHTIPPGKGCFALLRWAGKVIGRTPLSNDDHEPIWNEQIFAVHLGQSLSDDVLDIDIYFADELACAYGSAASAPAGSPFEARCRLRGPFTSERFPAYASDYPLSFPGEAEKAQRTAVDNQGAQRSARISNSGQSKQDNVGDAGSVSLRVGITASAISVAASSTSGGYAGKTADHAAIGDEDTPEVRRRKTNTVTRRLRLHVGWVSLARMMRPSSSSPRPPKEDDKNLQVTTPDNTRTPGQPAGGGSARPRRSRQKRKSSPTGSTRMDVATSVSLVQSNGSSGPKTVSLAHLPGATSGLWCHVSWCGVRVASFEICPKTGLPVTPGECLLDLARGTAWESCRLVLEVVAAGGYMQHPHMQEARDRWAHLRQGDLRGNPHAGGGLTETDDNFGPTTVEEGPCCLLGMVVIGWQALKALKEEPYLFTTCPADATPEASSIVGREKGYLDLNCSLCIPAAITDSPIDEEDKHPSPALDTGSGSDSTDGRGVCAVLDAADGGTSASKGESHAWRILPARLAMSLRLERLTPSRSPRPRRMPQAAPTDSVCRLRVGILGCRKLIRTAHPKLLWPGHPVPTSYTVIVGWNGYHQTVRSPLEWPVQVPLLSDSRPRTSGLSTDLLLEVPRTGRKDLVLTFRMVASSPQMRPRGGEGIGAVAKYEAESETLGRAWIDWDGLSCLPVSATAYMVETPDGRQAYSTRQSLDEPAAVHLEMTATNSPPRNTAFDHSIIGTQKVGSASGVSQALSRSNKQHDQGLAISCCRTAGVSLRVSLLLETSPASAPHVLSLSPVAARGPTTGADCGSSSASSCTRSAAKTTTQDHPTPESLSLGDFRNPCRRHRIPYLRFSWPWDDSSRALIERRNSPVPRAPWTFGSRLALRWTKPAIRGISNGGAVSCRLPLELSALDGSVSWPGSQYLRDNREDNSTAGARCTPDVLVRRRGSTSRRVQQKLSDPPVVFVEAYDMGPYAQLEHRAATTVQRLWRRALCRLRSAREWWEYYAAIDRNIAAVCVQANYRGWKGRMRARYAEGEAAEKAAAATAIQYRWRCYRARRKAEELRTEGLQKLRELERLEQEREARRLELRRAGLCLLIARGAGLLGMDISGLSDPFCVALWNGREVGRTAVRHGTRCPDWLGDSSNGEFASGGSAGVAVWFDLPFFVPETEKWGEEKWPPMHLEIRCYDHDIMGPADLIGCVKLGPDAILAMVKTASTDRCGAGRPGRPDAPAEVTWLELMPDSNDGDISTLVSRQTGITNERNPFKSLGDIAVALKARRTLPNSVEEYGLSKEEEQNIVNTRAAIADAGVLALLQAVHRALCSRDRGLWVVNASGLVGADFFGKSDPYAKVFWDGREIGTTSVRHKTLNPVWFAGAVTGKHPKVAGAATSQEEKPYFWLESTSSANACLRVELYDWDAVGSHDFLGGVELDMAELVELQRLTLRKARAKGGNTDQQMLLKTDYPLRSRDNKVGKNGMVGLCVYLDLEQRKRMERREQAAAARRQQAIDLAIAEVDMKNEALERRVMGNEDFDAHDMEQIQRQQEMEEDASWQIYYDDSTDPPIPWWFNSATGASTWEFPSAAERTSDLAKHNEAGQLQRQLVVSEEQVDEASAWQIFHDDESAGEPIPWWFNSVTGESTWDCPTALMVAVSPSNATEAEVDKLGPQQEPQELAIIDTHLDPGWAELWSEEYQAYYYVNEATAQTSWDAPITRTVGTAVEGEGERVAPTAISQWTGHSNNNSGPGNNANIDGGEGQALVAAPAAANTSGGGATAAPFPFYINERGNRVFCVPKATRS